MQKAPSEIQGRAAEFARILREHLPGLKDRYGVDSIGIFGSYIRGEEKDDSDLDVLVDFARVPDLFEFVSLGIDLSELLGINVDLVMKRALKPRIGQRILEEVVLV